MGGEEKGKVEKRWQDKELVEKKDGGRQQKERMEGTKERRGSHDEVNRAWQPRSRPTGISRQPAYFQGSLRSTRDASL